jgi:hypothetical protein
MTPVSMAYEIVGIEPGRVAESAVDGLLRVAEAARFFRSADGRFHASVPLKNRHEIFGLKSAAFRDWLIASCRADCGEVPAEWAIRRALWAIEGRVRFDDATPAIHVRVGRESEGSRGDCYLDLCDNAGGAIRINAREWTVVESPPVHFRRAGGQLPLPIPRLGGSIDQLRPYVNLTDQDFRLLIAWMAAALLPEGPYPILAIHGEQGSAKSTLAKVIRSLIDPQVAPVLAEPRSTRDLMATALSSWLLVYDNISEIPNWLSDSLCRLATGGGFAGRTLYSDDERHVIQAQRPVILNGIEDFVHRDDLADRCVFLNLPPIESFSRRAEAEFWRAFSAERPAILGGLLSAVVGGLRELPSVQLTELPRMADFACVGEAVGRALGWPEGTFLATYSENRQETTVTALEESVLATVLLDSAAMGGLVSWTLSATEMLKELGDDVPGKVRASSRWPKSPRAFTNELRRIAPGLRTRGISVNFTKTRDNRLITIDADRSFDYSRAPHFSNPERGLV